MAISVGTTAILARILTPSDYGMVAMVGTLTAFFEVFSDCGLSTASIQKRDLTRAQVDNLFWLNVLAGAALWGGCVLAGPLLGSYFRVPGLAPIAALTGLGFLLGGFSVQPLALLSRRMRLKEVSIIRLSAHFLGACAGVCMAFLGLRYWALVGQSLAVQAAVLALVLGHVRYRPGLPKAGQGTVAMLKFGGHMTVFGILIYLVRNLDNALVGRFWGAEQLGYYSRAYFLTTFPMTLIAGSVGAAVIPALSCVNHDRQRMEELYRKTVGAIGAIGFPVAIGLVVIAPWAIRLVYGPKWAPVVPIFYWLCIATVLQPVYATADWLLIACGRTWELVLSTAAVTAIVVTGFAVGVHWGTAGVACSFAITMGLLVPGPLLWFAHRVAGIQFHATVRAIAPYLGAAIVMGVIATACGQWLTPGDADWRISLAVRVLAGLVTYGALRWKQCKAAAQAVLTGVAGTKKTAIPAQS
jgi:PST family polysaccharide transporter